MADLQFNIEQPALKTHPTNLSDHVMEHVTTVAHVCIIGIIIYVVYLCFMDELVLFTWHPLLYGIAWMMLMTEAVFMITKNNIFSNRIPYKLRVRIHWIMQTVVVAMSFSGFFAGLINKNLKNLPHFKTWHALLGLICLIFSVPVCLNGITALYNVEMRNYISPRLNKFVHAVCGIATVVLGGLVMVLSLYSKWFDEKTGGNKDIFVICYVAIVFGTLWCIVGPMITVYKRVKSYN